MQIGCFRVEGDGFVGRLRTLTLDVAVRLVPTGVIDHGNMPDWRVHLEDTMLPDGIGAEVGAGWTHSRSTGEEYLKLQLHCPSFPRPLRANLLPSMRENGEHVLLWSPGSRSPKEA